MTQMAVSPGSRRAVSLPSDGQRLALGVLWFGTLGRVALAVGATADTTLRKLHTASSALGLHTPGRARIQYSGTVPEQRPESPTLAERTVVRTLLEAPILLLR